MRNVILYSKHCPHSQKFLQLMQNTDFAREFSYVSIDPDPQTRKKNEELLFILEITKVPTVYVNGSKYDGTKAFEWLNAVLNRQSPQQPTQAYAPQVQPNGAMKMPPPQQTRAHAPPQQPQSSLPAGPGGDGGFNPQAMTSPGGPDNEDYGDLQQFFARASAPGPNGIGTQLNEDTGFSSQADDMTAMVDRIKAERARDMPPSMTDTRMAMSQPQY